VAAKGAADASYNVADVNKLASDSAQGAHQVNNYATELAKVAGNLKGVVSQFKV